MATRLGSEGRRMVPFLLWSCISFLLRNPPPQSEVRAGKASCFRKRHVALRRAGDTLYSVYTCLGEGA